MRTTEVYSVTCACGKSRETTSTSFTCECGRKSFIDFSARYTEKELIAILNNLDERRDQVVRHLEIVRDRRAS